MTEALLCSQCGAPLEVPSGVTYCQCRHCNTALMIHREPSVVYTEVINRLDRDVSQMAWQLAELRYEKEIERLQEEWDAWQEEALATDKHGNAYVPTGFEPYLGIIVGVVLVVMFGVVVPIPLPLRVATVVGIALIVGWYVQRSHAHYRSYRRADLWYKNKLRSLKVEDFLP